MNRMLSIACALCLAGTVLWAADPPRYVNYQGVLRNSAGGPLSGSYDMAFAFYDDPSAGTLLVTDTHAGAGRVIVSNGLFNVALGSGTLTPPAVPFVSIFAQHQTIWMQLVVGGETLSPRVQILAAPFAQNANTLDGYEAVSFAAASHTHDASAVTSGTLGAVRGGTGLSGPGTSGNVLTSNGTNWVSIGLPTPEGLGAVMDASDSTLALTGGGYSGDPHKLKLNLGNANTWTGAQTFGATTNFPGSGIWDSTGKVGIGTSAPSAPFSLSYAQPYHNVDELNRGARIGAVAWPVVPSSGSTDHFYGLDCATNGAPGTDTGDVTERILYGIRSSATAGSNWHYTDLIGVEGNATGASGDVWGLSGNASGGSRNVGVWGRASGTAGNQYGVAAYATGTTSTYHCGLEAGASGGSINWAGVFTDGNVRIVNNLGIGVGESSPPLFPLDVQAAQAVARFTTTANTNGAVIELKNTTSSPTLIGAINFSNTSTYVGQIAYVTGDYLRLNNSTGEKVRVGGTYSLQLFADSAVKPGTNTWNTPSDRRLKRDIAPFKDGLAVIEKINPISYRYNGLGGTPADMPCIGVIAQEIRNVAPYTVGTFKAKLNERDEATTDLLDFNSHALTFVMINAIKELDERTKGLVKDTESKGSADKKSAASADEGASYAESGLLLKTSERSAQGRPSDVFQDELGNVYGRSFRPSLAEMATLMPSSEPIEAGDLLVADDLLPGQVRLSSRAADPKVLGVATGEPGVCLNSRPRLPETNVLEPTPLPRVPVALSGIVLCKVDASSGPIAVGDLLTTSSIPGHAMSATDPKPGTIMGKALEPLASGPGVIKVLMMLR